jgi:hypothetical protein
LKSSIYFLGVLLLALSEIRASWWDENSNPESWAQARESLGNQLRQKLQKEGPAALKPGSSLEKEFRLWQWLGEWPEARGVDPIIFAELGKNQELVRVYLENIQKEDRRGQVLEILSKMQTQAPQETKDLPALAVAIALVFDQPFPNPWPHHQVPASAVPREAVDPVQRLKEMAQLQGKRRYALNLPDLSVNELKFLVDHPLPESEMEWARKNVTTSRSSFDKVFSSIRYDFARLQVGVMTWPYPNYQLADIKEKGGICVDQGYFAAMAGKAKGLPTLFFTGQGDSGGHAWFGYLDAPGRWVTDCGKYAEENYPVGQAMDPQIWKPITDTELTFLAKGRERSEGYRQAKLWTDYATAMGPQEGGLFIDAALALQPEFLSAWSVRGSWLDQTGTPQAREDFWQAFVKRFARYPDLKVAGQEKLLELAKVRGDEATTKNLERQILVQNRTKRFDLSIGATAAKVGEKIEAGDWVGAESAYRQALREFKGQSGGHLLYGLVAPFVETALAEGQPKTAKNALQEAKRVLKAGKDTLVGQALLELESQVKAAQPAG